MKFKPLHDRVLLRRLDDDEKTAGGIIIPDTAKEKPMRAEVVAVGPGARLDNGKVAEMAVAVGDIVLIGKYAGTETTFNDGDYVVVREDDILGIDVGATKKSKK